MMLVLYTNCLIEKYALGVQFIFLIGIVSMLIITYIHVLSKANKKIGSSSLIET